MEKLKSIEKRNKTFKRLIKKIESEIDLRTKTNPTIEDYQQSQVKWDLDEVGNFHGIVLVIRQS